MKPKIRSTASPFEVVVGSLFTALICAYGWLTLVNERVTLTWGRHGRVRSAELVGSESLAFTAGVFAAAAVVAAFTARRAGLSRVGRAVLDALMLVQPAVWVALIR